MSLFCGIGLCDTDAMHTMTFEEAVARIGALEGA